MIPFSSEQRKALLNVWSVMLLPTPYRVVTVRLWAKSNEFWVVITDNGEGIAAENLSECLNDW